ncbi:MAG: cytochrome P450 [Gammaproteobacteria bacterium]|nr:cytochrome P450 [Gammaproteobacteria bacterium]
MLDNAIEEMLRFEPPIQMTVRFVARRTHIEGVTMKPGQMVMISLGAANRDPTVYTEPHRFDIERTPMKHIAFGYGIHLCLGLALARLEAKMTFEKLLDRFGCITLEDSEPAWQGNPFFRGLEHLHVDLR